VWSLSSSHAFCHVCQARRHRHDFLMHHTVLGDPSLVNDIPRFRHVRGWCHDTRARGTSWRYEVPGRNLSRQAERMSRGIEKHPPPVGGWLHRREPGSQPFRLDDRRRQVAYREIQVNLLGDARVWLPRLLATRDGIALSATQSVRTTAAVVLVKTISPPSIAAQNSASGGGPQRNQRHDSATSDCQEANLNPG
jgi:hypothetical protein